MLDFLVDNILVDFFSGKVFPKKPAFIWEQITPLLADIFLYSYEAEFVRSLLSTDRKQLASIVTYRYIDDVLCTKNQEFENNLGQIYLLELKINDMTESKTSASYPDLLVDREGRSTSLFHL